MIDSELLLNLGEPGPLYDYCEEHGLDREVADRLIGVTPRQMSLHERYWPWSTSPDSPYPPP